MLTARVNALAGLGQVVTGGAVLVLVSWWYGHFRRRRRIAPGADRRGRQPAVPDVGRRLARRRRGHGHPPADEVGRR